MNERDEMLKRNLIRLAMDHRDSCKGACCNVQLSLLLEVAIRAGIFFSIKEQEYFL